MTRDGAKMYGEHLGRGSRVGVKVQRCEGRETLSSGSGTRGSDSAHPPFFRWVCFDCSEWRVGEGLEGCGCLSGFFRM
nr:hypothetical protein [Candidatus Freyarchaeota archaeon]